MHEIEAEAAHDQEDCESLEPQKTPQLTPLSSPETPTLTPPPSSASPRSPSAVMWALRNQVSSFGSESGTEADDELPKKLPAPPRKRNKGLLGVGEEVEEEDAGEITGGTTGDRDGVEDDDRGGRRRKGKDREGGKELLLGGGEAVDDAGQGAKRRRKKIAFVRRGVEVALMAGVVGVTLAGKRRDGGKGRVWEIVWEEFNVGEYQPSMEARFRYKKLIIEW